MIFKIEKSDARIKELEETFPQILGINSVTKAIESNPFTFYYIYVESGKIVGFINYDILYERAEIINIAVVEEKKRQGIGSQLIENMIEDCQKRSVINITLEVRINNQEAIYLYKKYGFQEVAIRKGYYRGIDAILMEKELRK